MAGPEEKSPFRHNYIYVTKHIKVAGERGGLVVES